jgi:serine phosphatase RsbU (regulator of sigma subunit)
MVIDPLEISQREPAATSSLFQGVQLSTRIMPAMLGAYGGDWCETFIVSEDVIALSIGDVCGHGIEKFDTMFSLRKAIHDAVGHGLDPAQALAEANRFLRRYDPEEYATALFALLNIRSRSLVFANAGHPPPLVTGPGGTSFLEFPNADFPLGLEANMVPVLHVVSVPEETLLIFYTDGVSEHARKPLDGARELHDAAIFAYNFSVLPTAAVIEKRMCLTGSNHDDAAILTAWLPPTFVPQTLSDAAQLRG